MQLHPSPGQPRPFTPARVPCRGGSRGSPWDAGTPSGQQQPCETESGRKAKRSDASAPCDVHVKQPVPVDTARRALPPQQRARFAQQREVCGGRHPGSIPGHPAAPSPTPRARPAPAAALLGTRGTRLGCFGHPQPSVGTREQRRGSRIRLWRRRCIHPAGCIHPQETPHPPGLRPSRPGILAPPRGCIPAPRSACIPSRGASMSPGSARIPPRSPGPGAAAPPWRIPRRIPSSRGGPGQDAAPSSPPVEETPLPQPLQMAARSLTRADRLGAPGQMGLAPAASSPLLFPSLFALFFPLAQPPFPSQHRPPAGGRQPR